MRQLLWNKILVLSFAFECLILVTPAAPATQNFSGDFTGSYVDIPFTIDVPSEIKFAYNSLCENPDDLKFYLRVAQRVDNFDSQYSITFRTDTTSPVEGIPLHQGEYIARLTCSNVLNSPSDPEWSMTIISTPISMTFAQDQEPESEDPLDLYATRSFTGWLGLWGTPGEIHPTASSSQGRDYYDTHFFNMKKGAKLKFKFEWADFRMSMNEPEINFGVLVYRYKNGNTYFVHSFERVTVNGGFTDEITLLEDGVYKIDFGGAAVGFNEDRKRYGGYKATIMINGEPEPAPPPGLFLTFQDAEWVRQQNQSQEYPYNLVINFQIGNTYNISKSIRDFAQVNAPVLNFTPDSDRWDTETNDRAMILAYYAIMVARDPRCGESESSDGALSKYCQYNRLGADYMYDGQESHNCLYYVSSPAFSQYYSIPPHGLKDRTILIPATFDEYRNFDESCQIIVLAIQDQAIHPGTTGNDGCHLHGLYFMPARAFIPSVNLLLQSD